MRLRACGRIGFCRVCKVGWDRRPSLQAAPSSSRMGIGMGFFGMETDGCDWLQEDRLIDKIENRGSSKNLGLQVRKELGTRFWQWSDQE